MLTLNEGLDRTGRTSLVSGRGPARRTGPDIRVSAQVATPAGLARAAGLLMVRIVIVLLLFVLAFVLVEAWRPDVAVIALDLFSR
jgi:hypothetical protein